MAITRKMLTQDWIKVQDNPIQRDTERHALKAKHLRNPHPTHSVVHAAQLPNDKLVKLDGHTRALLWKRKEIAVPLQVTVVTYPVKDMAEAEQLYQDFDSKDALETTRDKVSGAYNKHDFNPQSPLLQYGTVVQGLRIALGVLLGGSVKTAAASGGGAKTTPRQREVSGATVYQMVNEFSAELHMLDGFGLRQGQITSGIIAAFIISARKYGHEVTTFWTGVFGNAGTKRGGEMDGIEAVSQLIAINKGRGFNKMKTADIAARALMGLEKWRKGEMLGRMPSPMDTTGYLEGHKRPAERLIKKRDMERAKIDRERANGRNYASVAAE
jgi:hypothetical protein